MVDKMRRMVTSEVAEKREEEEDQDPEKLVWTRVEL